MTARTYRVRCFECNPAEEYPAEMIFTHWLEVHDLAFEIFEVLGDEERLIDFSEIEDPDTIPLEVDLERIEAQVKYAPWITRPYYRWRIRKLRREISDLRDYQINRLLQ